MSEQKLCALCDSVFLFFTFFCSPVRDTRSSQPEIVRPVYSPLVKNDSAKQEARARDFE
jgi:hypothetical protein